MKAFYRILIAAISMSIVGCSVQNSVGPVEPAEKTVAVTTPQGEIQTVKTPDGSLCIFMRGANNRLYYKKQNSATGFSTAWSQIAGTSQITGNIATYCSGAYPVYVFSKNANSNLVVSKQTVNNGSWSTWQVIGGSFQINSDIAVAGDWNGCINVFARKSADNKLYYLTQSGVNGSFPSSWYGPMCNEQVWSKFAVIQHKNFAPSNGLTVFYASDQSHLSKQKAGMGYKIHAIHQYGSVGWVYDPIDNTGVFGTDGSIVAGNYADGRMIVFGINLQAGLILYMNCLYTDHEGWSPWVVLNNQNGGAAEPMALGTNSDGRLEIFYNRLTTPYTLWHQWQTVASGSWIESSSSVGNFPTVLCQNPSWWGTKIVTDRFQNGTLAAFAQTSAFSGNPIGYTNFDCNYPGCWLPGPVSLGNP